MTSQYREFASVYDRLMNADIDYDKWCDYIENIFTINNISPDSICELACGTGNITGRLQRRGYDMTGVDISSDMLEIAAEKVGVSSLICSDMSKLNLSENYDAFLCMIDGLNYVITPKAVVNTFKCVKSRLRKKGVFIFDVSSEYKLKNVIGNETFIHSDYDIFYSWQNRYIEKYNLSDMLLNFFVEKKGCYDRFEERHLQRGWTKCQMIKMLKMAGFTEISVFDELSFNEPSPESERLVFVCK